MGLINGGLIVKTGVPSFIVTLGMMGVARGFALVITKGSTISGLPSEYLVLGQGFMLGVPIPVVIMVRRGHCRPYIFEPHGDWPPYLLYRQQ